MTCISTLVIAIVHWNGSIHNNIVCFIIIKCAKKCIPFIVRLREPHIIQRTTVCRSKLHDKLWQLLSISNYSSITLSFISITTTCFNVELHYLMYVISLVLKICLGIQLELQFLIHYRRSKIIDESFCH